MFVGLSIQLAMLLASIGWLVLMMAIVRVMNYCHKFEEFNHRNEKELISINNQLRKTNEYLGSMLLEISSINRTVKVAVAEQTGRPEIEDVEFTADKGVFREFRREDELIAKAKEESKAKIKEEVKTKIKAKPVAETKLEVDTSTKIISKSKIKAAVKTPKIPLPPTRQGPVIEIIPKMDKP